MLFYSLLVGLGVALIALVTVSCCRVGAQHDAVMDDEESGFLLQPLLKRKRGE